MERPHGYSSHQLFICKNGKGIFVFKGNKKIVLQENDALILRKNVPHHYYPLDNCHWELAFLCFHEAFPIIESLSLPTEEVFNLSSNTIIYRIIETVWTYDQLDPGSQQKMSAAIYEILLKLHEQNANLQNLLLSKKQGISIVEQVATFLNEHYSQSWTVEEISKYFGYSSQHLNRLFKSFHSCTIHQYLRKIRLERATTLLKEESELTVERIAEQIGMDTGYFIRLFQATYDITPGTYRKKYFARFN
jgi:AraC-like DNA-binding protein